MKRLISIGEVLWDLIEGQAHIGGAPFNLAAHAARLGMDAWLVSAVGDDDLGAKALERVRALRVHDEFVRVVPHPTGVVDVRLDASGRPTFEIRRPAAWDFIGLGEEDRRALAALRADAVCYGTLAQRSATARDGVRRVLAALAAPGGPLRFCDVNLRAPFYDASLVRWAFESADVLKLNDDEVRTCAGLLPGAPGDVEPFCAWAAGAFGLRCVCVTLGAAGCAVYADGRFERCPGVKVRVADTVGAGDAFSAAFLRRWLDGAPAAEAGRFACRVGALVASKPGAVPDYDPEECDLLR